MRFARLIAALLAALPSGWTAPLAGSAVLLAGLPLAVRPALASTWCSVGVNYTLDCHDDPDPVTPGSAPRPPPLFSGYQLYTAIALSSSTNRAAIVWQSESLSGAKSAAMARCAKAASAKDCKVVGTSAWCLSMAQSPDGAWGTSANYVIEQTRAGAMKACQSQGGKACKVTVEHCAADS